MPLASLWPRQTCMGTYCQAVRAAIFLASDRFVQNLGIRFFVLRPTAVQKPAAQELSRLASHQTFFQRSAFLPGHALTDPSTGGPARDAGSGMTFRGGTRAGAYQSRTNLVWLVQATDNEEVMRIRRRSSERRTQSFLGTKAHGFGSRDPRHLETHPRHTATPRHKWADWPETVRVVFSASGFIAPARRERCHLDHAPVRHEPPTRNKKAARQGHDHGLASAEGPFIGAGSKTTAARHSFLEHEKSPRPIGSCPPNFEHATNAPANFSRASCSSRQAEPGRPHSAPPPPTVAPKSRAEHLLHQACPPVLRQPRSRASRAHMT